MSDKQKRPVEVGKSDPQPVRTKDNPLGIDDIGLPSGIQPDEVRKLQEIKPEPEKAKK